MTFKGEHHGVEYWVTVEEVFLPDGEGGHRGGNYYAAFSLQIEPPAIVAGESIKDANGRPRFFDERSEAMIAAEVAAQRRIDSRTSV